MLSFGLPFGSGPSAIHDSLKTYDKAPVKPKFFERLISNVGLSKKSKHTKNGIHSNKEKLEDSLSSGDKNSGEAGCDDSLTDVDESLAESYDEDLFKNIVFSEPELSPDNSSIGSNAFTFSTPSSPELKPKGIVRQRCEELQNVPGTNKRFSTGTKSTPSSPKLRTRDLPHSLRYNFSRGSSIGVYSALTRNEKFCHSVMSKGFVKALVEQINETNLPSHKTGTFDHEEGPAFDRRLSSSSEDKKSDLGNSKVEKPAWVKSNSFDIDDNSNIKPSSLLKDANHSKNLKIRSRSVPCNDGESLPIISSQDLSKISEEVFSDTPPLSSSEKALLSSDKCDKTDHLHSTDTNDPAGVIKAKYDSGCSIRTFSEEDAPPMSPAEQFEELFDSSWSDSDPEMNHSDGEESDVEEKLNETFVPPVESSQPKDKLHNIAEEFLKTEKTYVDRLHLLDQVFRSRLIAKNQEDNFLPPETFRQLFSNINSIFTFHHDFLLPELEERLQKWSDEKRIGDLMKKNAPFLKMYTEYIKNFDTSMNMINQLMDKNPKFASTVQEIQKLKECGLLTLQHHMLGPIQRVPRYELLLKDYIKHLPEDSPDAKDSQDALVLVTEAASHSNQAMKKIEKFRKLLEIHQSLGGMIDDLVSPTRELIKEGKITKISARSGEKQDRYVFLFNDLLLLCSEPLLGTYKIRARLDVDSMELKESQNRNLEGSFYVISKQKVVEFYDENNGSTEELPWKEIIENVIKEFRERKLKLPPIQVDDIPENELATRAPCWLKDTDVSMCMKCELPFSRLKRRHHCRSCGKIFCQRCSSKKAPLKYDKNRLNRVCDRCFSLLVSGDEKPENTKKGILQQQADDPSVIASYLLISSDKGKTWTKRWFAARDNFVLYIYRAHQDVSAIQSIPLPGYIVEGVKEKEVYDKSCVLKIHHLQRKDIYYIQTEQEKQYKKWMSILDKMARLELPNTTQRLSSNSTCSSNSDDIIDIPL